MRACHLCCLYHPVDAKFHSKLAGKACFGKASSTENLQPWLSITQDIQNLDKAIPVTSKYVNFAWELWAKGDRSARTALVDDNVVGERDVMTGPPTNKRVKMRVKGDAATPYSRAHH